MKKGVVRKIIVYSIYILLVSLATFSFTDIINYKGVTPEYFLVFCILIGYLHGPSDLIPIAIISGSIKDMFSGRLLGISILTSLYIGLLAANLFKKYFDKNILVSIAQVIIGTSIYTLSIYFSFYIFNNINHSLLEYLNFVFYQRFIPVITLNVVIGIILYLIIKYISPYSKKIDIYDEVITTKSSRI